MPERYRRAEDALADLIRENRRGTRDSQRATGTEKLQAAGLAQDAVDRVGAVEDELAGGAVVAALVPKAPGVVTVAANTGAFTPAGPVAAVTLTIPAVTKSTDNEDIEIAEYELWDANGPLVRVPASPAKVTLPTGGTAVYRARACSAHGVWGDLSVASATVTGASPAVQSGKNPTGVTGRTGFGVVVCDWLGAFASAPAAHTLLNVQVQARVGTSGAWVMQGTMDRAGSVTLKLGEAGQTVQMQAVAYDRLGRVIGTSATVSTVVQGIEFDDFDALVQGRIEGIESGQVVIGRTVDGLNRTFTSVASPGRGYVGYENVAPSLYGPTVPVEVRRNYCKYANAEGGVTTGWTANNGTVTVSTSTAEFHSGTRSYQVNVAGGTAGSGVVAHTATNSLASGQTTDFHAVWVKAPAGTPMRLFVQERTTADAFVSQGASTNFSATGAWQMVSATITKTVISNVSRVAIIVSSSAAVTFYFDDVMTGPGLDPLSYFDGNSSPDPDMTARWIGAANASESVLEGQHPTAFTDSNCVSIIHEVGDGTRELRQIPTNSNADSFTQIALPVSTRASGTVLGTSRSVSPISPPVHGSGYALGLCVGEPTQFAKRPNDATTTDLRLAYTSITTDNYARWYHGGTRGSGDVYWSKIGLYAGTLPETVETLHQGDVWYRLETKNGALAVVEILIWNGGDWVPYELWVDSLAAANSVTARTINMDTGFADKFWANTVMAGRVRVDHLAPNVGDTLNIGGNAVAINLNSRVDGALVDLEQVRQDADAAQSSADAAGAVADAASQAVATLAAGRVLTAETALAALSGKIDTYENSFLFLPDGLHIRESTSAQAEMVLTSAGARLVADGVSVSEWNQGQMIVPQIVAKSGQIANHIIDSSIAGHTTFRAIS